MPSSNQRDVATATQQTEPQVQTTAPQREDSLGSSVEDPMATEKPDTKEERQRQSKESLEKARAARQAEGFNKLNPKDWRGNPTKELLGKDPSPAQMRGLSEERSTDLASRSNATDNREVDGTSLWGGLEAAWDSLEDRLAGKVKESNLMAGGNAGERLAGEMVKTDVESLQNATDKSTEKLVKDAVGLTRYAGAASKDVLAKSEEGGGLSEKEKWAVVETGFSFMKHIREGMKINKVIPNWQAMQVLNTQLMNDYVDNESGEEVKNNKVANFVGNAANYEKLTGAETISALGLDYGGTTEQSGGERKFVKKQNNSENVVSSDTPQNDNKLSGFVKRQSPDSDEVTVSQNHLFYISFDLPAEHVSKVKIPVASSIEKWAREQLEIIKNWGKLNTGDTGKRDARAAMAQAGLDLNEDEVSEYLSQKSLMLERFISNLTSQNPLALLNNKDTKNPQDPFAGTGMTRPGSRLQHPTMTINQEYKLSESFALPENTGLYLKGSDGEDDELLMSMVKDGTDQIVWDVSKKEKALKFLREKGLIT